MSTLALKFNELQELNEKLKVAKEMLDESLHTDSEYVAFEDKLDRLKREARLCLEALLNEPVNKRLKEELDEIKEDVKIAKESISATLVEHYQATGSFEYVDEHGDVHVFSVKASPKKAVA